MIAMVNPAIEAELIALAASVLFGGLVLAFRFGAIKQAVKGLEEDMRNMTKGFNTLSRAVYSAVRKGNRDGGTPGDRLESDHDDDR